MKNTEIHQRIVEHLLESILVGFISQNKRRSPGSG